MLTGRPYQTIGQQDKNAIGKGRSFSGPGQQLVEDAPQTEAIEERPHGRDRPPGRGIDDLDGLRIFTRRHRRAEQSAFQLGQEKREEILATQISDDTLFDFAVVAVGFDDTDVLVDVAAGRRDFNDADIHALSITTVSANVNGNLWRK